MCQPLTECMSSKQSNARQSSSKKSLLSKVWPLSTPLVLAFLPFLPTTFYINRGYTVWFHLLSMVYLFTRSPFIRKMLILQGTGICLGWYCAIVNEYLAEGGFCHTLYRNMPGAMLPHMVEEHGAVGNYTILDGHMALLMKVLSHALDTLGHPGLAYLFWKLELKSQSTTTTASPNNGRNSNKISIASPLRDVLTMPVIVASWHLSRTWSLVHSYYNTGTPKFWYYGHDVYLLDNLDSYLIAYIAEGVCFGMAILCRMYWDRVDQQSLSTKSMEPSYYENVISGEKLEDDSKPSLVHSESAMSSTSIISS